MTSENKPNILIVDDDMASNIVLEGFLYPLDYHVQIARDSENALRILDETDLDLILLDIMMPGMSGFELCEIFKSKGITEQIPVLFITSLSDSKSHKRAIECGGKGFIVKPFDEDLIRSYVTTFVGMKRMRDYYQQQLQTYSDFMAMVFHDLNNLNMVVLGNLELASYGSTDTEDSQKYIQNALFALKTTNHFMRNIQDIAKLKAVSHGMEYARIDLVEQIRSVAKLMDTEMKAKNLKIELRASVHTYVCGIGDLLFRLVLNLLDNAIKHSWPDTVIIVQMKEKKKQGIDNLDEIEVVISNQCDPIPKKYQEVLFEKFRQGPNQKERKRGTGLGLAFCKAAIEAQRGRIWVESPLLGYKTGVAIHFTIPVYNTKCEEIENDEQTWKS